MWFFLSLGLMAFNFSDFVERLLVYFPERELIADPLKIGRVFIEDVFQTKDGRKLYGWWIEHPQEKASLLFFHGNAGNICIVVLFDARNFATKDFLFEMYLRSSMLGSTEYMQMQDGHFKEIKRNGGLLTNRMRYISAIAVMYK